MGAAVRYVRILLLALSLFFVFFSPVSAKWAYPFVVNEGSLFVITEEVVDEALLGEVVGKVTNHSSDEAAYHGGNFSNQFPKGTKYYAIQGTPSEEAIAIRTKEGTYIKAIYEGEYNGGDEFYLVILRWLLIAIAVIGIPVVVTRLVKRRKV